MSRVVIVGAGIVGTMHAVLARRAGWHVTHIDADPEPRSASVRNFGLVWVSGRAEGDELALALRARELWGEIAVDVPGVGLRADGSVLVVQQPEELAVLEQVMARADADARGFELLDPTGVRRVNPAIGGEVLAGLHCTTDAVVEPRLALPALRTWLEAADADAPGAYAFHGGRIAVEIGPGYVVDHTGERHRAEVVIVCPGAERHGPIAELLQGAPVRRVRLQMMQTAPLGERLTTSVADGDSLRYYPAFAVPALADLPPQAPVAAEHHMQLLISERASGELTVGDTHAYDEPFDFAASEDAYDHLHERAASILGRPLPPVVRRWTGIYSQALDGAICHRRQVQLGVWVVTGPGGRGMTLSPAIAEQTISEIGSPL
ncbi:MAG: TIGR03364 family FAD-dependent oxidoreductase [Acidimicrobiales bacterium]